VEQIVSGLDQVSVVVQSNTASAEESAAVSRELADQSKRMQELVSSFKLRD
jgi:methyl-accepting chemotaxis protein